VSLVQTAFSLGSNLGDRLRHLIQAKTLLLLDSTVTFVSQSPVYETEPVDVRPEYQSMKFLNAVLLVESSYSAEEWLRKIKKIESMLQRVRSEDRNAPRTIDIDVLFCGDQVVDSDCLQIPHPRWMKRLFVVQPLSDVCPDLVVPGEKRPVRQILEHWPEREGLQNFAKQW